MSEALLIDIAYVNCALCTEQVNGTPSRHLNISGDRTENTSVCLHCLLLPQSKVEKKTNNAHEYILRCQVEINFII